MPLGLALVGIMLAALPAHDTVVGVPMTYRVDAEQSIFAVVTHKAGFASRLAHNHLIVASVYEADLDFDPVAPLEARFEMTLPVTDLVVDDARLRDSWAGRLAELAVTDDLGTPGDDDRRKIREAMLAEDQLDADHHPRIAIRVVALFEQPTRVEDEEFPLLARVEFSIRGVTQERDIPVRYTLLEDELWIEAVGRLDFESFGIEPYSAFLGSVKNKNEFDIYLSVKAVR